MDTALLRQLADKLFFIFR